MPCHRHEPLICAPRKLLTAVEQTRVEDRVRRTRKNLKLFLMSHSRSFGTPIESLTLTGGSVEDMLVTWRPHGRNISFSHREVVWKLVSVCSSNESCRFCPWLLVFRHGRSNSRSNLTLNLNLNLHFTTLSVTGFFFSLPEKDPSRGNGRPCQVCSMPEGVHGRHGDEHLSRLPTEDTFVCRLHQ